MSSSTTSKAPDSSVLFARGVIARLSIWSTLRIAVQESWGGPEGGADKRILLASEIVDAFDNTTDGVPDDEYIEDMLLQIMEEEFEVAVEDGSAESVAKDIIKIYEEIKVGKTAAVLRFEEMAEKAKSRKVDAVQKVASDDEDWEEDSGEDEDEEMEDVPQLVERREPPPRAEPEVDEDGFTMVKGKGKGRR